MLLIMIFFQKKLRDLSSARIGSQEVTPNGKLLLSLKLYVLKHYQIKNMTNINIMSLITIII